MISDAPLRQTELHRRLMSLYVAVDGMIIVRDLLPYAAAVFTDKR